MELSLCHKLKFCNPYIFVTSKWKPMIFQTYYLIQQNLKYLGTMTFGCKDIGIRNLILWQRLNSIMKKNTVSGNKNLKIKQIHLKFYPRNIL